MQIFKHVAPRKEGAGVGVCGDAKVHERTGSQWIAQHGQGGQRGVAGQSQMRGHCEVRQQEPGQAGAQVLAALPASGVPDHQGQA